MPQHSLNESVRKLLKSMVETSESRVVGIDLAALETNPTGMCTLRGKEVEDTRELSGDSQIVEYVLAASPHLAAVDAPLSLPIGQKDVDRPWDGDPRLCERLLQARGIRYFPTTLKSMRELTRRGMHLRKLLEARGVRVIEVYPGASQHVWGIPRKGKGLEKLVLGLEGLGLKGLKKGMSGHELDAVTAAFTGFLFMNYRAEIVGDFECGAIVLPLSG